MTTENGKKRVALEQDKVRQTSHWDLDYLPLKEVDALYAVEDRVPRVYPWVNE
jgi:hypothetical protein